MMRRISLSLLAATAMGLIVSQGASAADMRMPVKAPAPLPPPVQDWSGIYVGLEGGYGWGKQNFDNFDPFFASKEGAQEIRKEICADTDPYDTVHCSGDAAIGSVNQSGWLFGGFAGAQKQWGSWVLGIEADFDAADIKGTTTASSSTSVSFGSSSESINQQHTINAKIDELGTLRGKVGWAWSPNWMIYGTGGLAFAHARTDFNASQSFCESSGGSSECFGFFAFQPLTENFIGGTSGSAGTSMLGWTIGAGIDYKWQLDQGSAVIFGVEYLHYQFGEHSLAFGNGPVFGGASEPGNTTFTIGNATQTIDAIKGRISWLFSIH
jgi:outer membrane immunogenic protein